MCSVKAHFTLKKSRFWGRISKIKIWGGERARNNKICLKLTCAKNNHEKKIFNEGKKFEELKPRKYEPLRGEGENLEFSGSTTKIYSFLCVSSLRNVGTILFF